MSTDGSKIAEDEELQKEIIRALKWIVIVITILILYGWIIYG